MANEQNLKPPFTSEQNREEAAKNGRKGGIASGEAKRKNKTLREMVELFGRLKVDGKAARAMEDLGIGEDMQTRFMQGVVSLFNKANKGDVGAFNAIRDIIGEKPVDKTQLQGTLDTNITIGYVESGHQPVTNEEEIPE
jgi:hypothetical protein